MIIASFFRKLTEVSTNNFKIDIKRIFDPIEMCKNIISAHKSLTINQLEILSHVHRDTHLPTILKNIVRLFLQDLHIGM